MGTALVLVACEHVRAYVCVCERVCVRVCACGGGGVERIGE